MKPVTSDIHANARQRWVILAVLFLARTAMGFQFQAVGALSSFVVADLGIDYAQLGLLIGLYLLPGVVVAYPGGLLGRYFGDKRVVTMGLGLMAAGGLLTMSSDDYPSILAARMISGVGAVLLNVLLTKMTPIGLLGARSAPRWLSLSAAGRSALVSRWLRCPGLRSGDLSGWHSGAPPR